MHCDHENEVMIIPWSFKEDIHDRKYFKRLHVFSSSLQKYLIFFKISKFFNGALVPASLVDKCCCF